MKKTRATKSKVERAIADLAVQLGQQMRERFDAVDQRFDAVDQRFGAVGQRFDAVDRRFDAVDRRFDAVDRRFDAVDERVEAVERRVEQTRSDLTQIIDSVRDDVRIFAEAHVAIEQRVTHLEKRSRS